MLENMEGKKVRLEVQFLIDKRQSLSNLGIDQDFLTCCIFVLNKSGYF